jgi:hypothetical protein
MIFPLGIVVVEAVTNFQAESIMMSLLSISPRLAPRGQERASEGVLVFPGMYRIL